jgi:shikimate kinase
MRWAPGGYRTIRMSATTINHRERPEREAAPAGSTDLGFALHPSREDIVVLGPVGPETDDVGFAVARLLGRPFVSCENLLVAHDGRSAREVFDHDGVDALRAAWRRVADIAMKTRTSVVFAGPAEMLDGDRRQFDDLFADAWVAWLDVAHLYEGDDPTPTDSENHERVRQLLSHHADLRLEASRSSHHEVVSTLTDAWAERRRQSTASQS